MSKLIIEPGHWCSPHAAEVETLLSQVGIYLGLTPKIKDFLNQVYDDIHGHFRPDEMYHQSIRNLSRLPSHMVLELIERHLSNDHKKQLKNWYTELLTIEPMNETNILIKMVIPHLSNTINNF